ncbi:MAG TPA: hypothetical protein VF184_03685 [Phycisphaeraceae bacterium]
MRKSLDVKLANIHADPHGAKDFILADAKDADMAYGMAAPGCSPEQHSHESRFRSLDQYRQIIRQNVQQGLIDIMLMSASTSEVLTIHERLFDASAVTPACRANDTTDIWLATGGVYASQPSRPFRTATIDHLMCGKVECAPQERTRGVDLGLYSITFNNDTQRDLETLEAYRQFRLEAEAKGFRHFLEVFDPNACGQACPQDLGRFINDQIARTLAGVAGRGRPLFLKIAYHGPRSMEELVSYDPHLVVGILGGSSGTTFDAFHQLWEARKYGARAALYGRMINNSEHQPTFIQHLRWLADGEIDDPAEAVKSYHGALQKVGVRPYRDLKDDLIPTLRISAYSGGAGASVVSLSQAAQTQASSHGATAGSSGVTGGVSGGVSGGGGASSEEPDFARMSQAEKIAWNLARWNRVLG